MKASNIIEKMNQWVPKDYIDSWDNTGFQIGDPERQVDKILIALDLDRDVLNKAIDGNFQMIITHHPIIFKPLTTITTMDYNTNIILDTIKHNIVVYNAHSNLDIADGGVNDCLANALGLRDAIPLSLVNRETLSQSLGYGRVGYVDKIGFDDYLEIIKTNLSAKYLVIYGDRRKYIEKVAVYGQEQLTFSATDRDSDGFAYFEALEDGTNYDAGKWETKIFGMPLTTDGATPTSNTSGTTGTSTQN